MNAPRFWFTSPGLVARMLWPLGWLYARATAKRLARGQRHALSVPVICVGNLNAGGTGKTPTVIAISEYLRDRYHQPHVVSRGYGGRLKGPLRVDPARHTAQDVGDEPLLLAAFSEVWIGRDRAATACAAVQAGASAIILDDGFQNPALAHDLGIVVVDAHTGFGNGYCLPAGPLREPMHRGLPRADLLLSIGDDPAQARFAQTDLPPDLPHATARLAPLQTGMDWQGAPVVAFAGIGHPEKFFATLRALGADLRHAEPLSDHQPLKPALMTRLFATAKAHGAQLVTTEKDAARLPMRYRAQVITLPVRLQFPAQSPLMDALDRLISPDGSAPPPET
jgi:tetraacyldisaccharide 4'-kinase